MNRAELDVLLTKLRDESEATIEDDSPYPAGTVPAHRADTSVQSVRLNTSDLSEIRTLSETTGTPVSALLRGWIIQGLAAERTATIQGSIDRLDEELKRLKRIAKG